MNTALYTKNIATLKINNTKISSGRQKENQKNNICDPSKLYKKNSIPRNKLL